MGSAFTVAIVLSPRPWSIRLHSFMADHVPDIDVVVVRDRRAVFDAVPDVLVVDDGIPWLTPAFLTDATEAGIRLVGVYDRTERQTRDHLVDLGLTHLLEEAMPPEDVVFLVDRLRPTTDLASAIAVEPRPPREERGLAIAVGGPSGSGAREVAAGLAEAWGAGRATLLVDANETTPGIARRFGLTPYPHILTAVDRHRAEGLPGIDAALADHVRRLSYEVIVGLPTPREWDRLVAHDVIELLIGCRDGFDRTVVTTSPLIEDLQRWGDRFGVSRRVLADADVVVGVVEPTPRGTLRYLDWLAEASVLRPQVVTVVNKVPKSDRVLREVARELAEVSGDLVADVQAIPADRKVTIAEWDGVPVRRGPFTNAVAALVAHLDDVAVSTPVGVHL